MDKLFSDNSGSVLGCDEKFRRSPLHFESRGSVNKRAPSIAVEWVLHVRHHADDYIVILLSMHADDS